MTHPAVLVGVPALLLIGVLSRPLLFSSSGFNEDWMEQLWFMWKQDLAIHANHLPSLFLNYRYGIFYPHYAFYGGTLYALTAVLALGLGDAPIAAYVLTYLFGFVAAYGGWYWMGRMAGLDRWWSQAPGVVFITSSYYLTLIYARGDWPEFIGVSTIPLMLASGLSVLRSSRLRLWPASALVLSSAVFFGSHSLTILWGSTMVIVMALALLACVPQARGMVTRAGSIRLMSLVVPALLLSAWFLLPAILYESQTHIASQSHEWKRLLRGTMPLVSAHHLFTLSRASASSPGAAFALALPILSIGWVIVALATVLRGGLRSAWVRVLLICSASTAAIVLLMTHEGLILALPRVYATLQFSYRLESYVLIGLCGAILAALVLVQDDRRGLRFWRWALLPVLAVAVIGAIQQADAFPRSTESRSTAFAQLQSLDAPGAGHVLLDYIDIHQAIMPSPLKHPPEIDFAPSATSGDGVSQTVLLPAGQYADSNLLGPPELLRVTGAKIAGISPSGYDVLEVDPAQGPRRGGGGRNGTPPTKISVTTADSVPVVLGRLLTLAAALTLALGLLTMAARAWRDRVRS